MKVKLLAYPFQKYGMQNGKVLQVSADATDQLTANNQNNPDPSNAKTQLAYRTCHTAHAKKPRDRKRPA